MHLSNIKDIGLGVQGLADVFIKMNMPFTSTQARELNKIFLNVFIIMHCHNQWNSVN